MVTPMASAHSSPPDPSIQPDNHTPLPLLLQPQPYIGIIHFIFNLLGILGRFGNCIVSLIRQSFVTQPYLCHKFSTPYTAMGVTRQCGMADAHYYIIKFHILFFLEPFFVSLGKKYYDICAYKCITFKV